MQRGVYLILLIVGMLFFRKDIALAGTNAVYTQNGDIVFETTDTIATTGIRWSEVGFTLRRDRSSGNPLKDNAYATLWLKEAYRSKKNNGDGTYKVTFTIPRKDTEKALSQAGILKGMGNILYLNGIFKVTRFGKEDSGYYRTLAGIKGAASWRNKRDFDELFDVKVTFEDPEPPEEKPPTEKPKKEGAGEAAPYVVIKAHEIGNEAFEATEGIPTEEPLYCTGWTREYIRSYEFKQVEGEKLYPVTVSRTYHLSWTERGTTVDAKTGEIREYSIPRSQSHTVSRTVYVKRNYSYWRIEDLYIGIPERMIVCNKAFPGETAVMEQINYEPPKVGYEIYSTQEHIQEPNYNKNLTLPSMSISGGSSAPSIPSENFQSYAEAVVGQIRVRNDYFKFKDNVIMDAAWVETKTKKPLEFPEPKEQTKDFVFLKEGLYIPVDRRNGIYESTGEVVYQPLVAIKKENDKIRVFPIEDINSVFVHTPVVCNGSIEDKYRECQMLFPDQERGALILGKSFQIILSAEGHHRNIKGYYYQDYSRYIKNRQVRFPFEVVYQGTRIPAKEWIEVSEIEEFYLPTDIKEGKYTVEFRCVAKNGEIGDDEERWANLSEKNYVAIDWIDVEISGQLKEFSIYDISDYPLWQQVFRKQNSLELTGFEFLVKDMPLKQGSHPLFENMGTLKAGYVLRMSCLTIGEMEKEDAYIRIVPRFYHISKDLKERREVDVYYSETVQGNLQQLIRIGSEQDKNNVKTLQLGDIYLSIPKKELKETAEKKKIPIEEFLKKEHKTFTFSNIMLSSQIQMLCDTKGVQKWYFEYYLPSKIYITEKGFSLENFSDRDKLNLQEDFWIKEGYLVLNFDIETIRNGERYLSYRNEAMSAYGYRNQWLYEKGEEIKSPYALGDVALLNLNQSAAIDYQSRGTH